jgi:hypothetical protein
MRIRMSPAPALSIVAAIVLLIGWACRGGIASPFGSSLRAAQSSKRQPLRTSAGTLSTFLRAGTVPVGHAPKSLARPLAQSAKMAYLSDYVNNAVYGFDISGKLMITITGLQQPQGLFVDRHGNVWVANTGADNIELFAKGSVAPKATYDDWNGVPIDVAVCPNGTAYVSNLNGFVTVYAPVTPRPLGHYKPTRSLSDPNDTGTYFITCDAAGNVFTTFQNQAGVGAVDEYVGGVQSGLVTLPIVIGFPGGIKPDRAGNLLICDQKARSVAEYTEEGVPTGLSISTAPDYWADFAVTRSGSLILGGDYIANVGTALRFPSGKPQRTYSYDYASLTLGAAYDPGQLAD